MKLFQLDFITDKAKLRYLRILRELELNDYCESEALTIATNSSLRSIVSDIRYLRDFFAEVASLESTNLGYAMKKIDSEAYDQLKRTLFEEEPLYVILRSICLGGKHSLRYWADKLHLSESTLLKYLKSVQSDLENYGLQFATNPVNLVGDEIDIRTFFLDFYYESEVTAHALEPSVLELRAVEKLVQQLPHLEFGLSSIRYLSFLLYFSLKRSVSGNQVELKQTINELVQKDPDYALFKWKYERIVQQFFNVQLSEAECSYVYLLAIGNRKIKNHELEHQFCEKYNRWPEIKQIIIDIGQYERFAFLAKQDVIFIEAFLTTATLRSRLSLAANKNTVDVNEYVARLFNEEYTEMLAALQKSQAARQLFANELLPDIAVQLTLLLESLKNQIKNKYQNIAFILEENKVLSLYIESWISKYVGRFKNVFFPSLREVRREFFIENNIDLLVTNESLYVTRFESVVQCLIIKSMPDATDLNHLLELVNPATLRHFELKDRKKTLE